jgi:hypothetical protein
MSKYLFSILLGSFCLCQSALAQYHIRYFGPQAKTIQRFQNLATVNLPTVDVQAELELDRRLQEEARLTKHTPPQRTNR